MTKNCIIAVAAITFLSASTSIAQQVQSPEKTKAETKVVKPAPAKVITKPAGVKTATAAAPAKPAAPAPAKTAARQPVSKMGSKDDGKKNQ